MTVGNKKIGPKINDGLTAAAERALQRQRENTETAEEWAERYSKVIFSGLDRESASTDSGDRLIGDDD